MKHSAEPGAGAGANIGNIRKQPPAHTLIGEITRAINPTPSPATILEISAEGRELALNSLQFRENDPDNPFFTLDETFFSKEAVEYRKMGGAGSLLEPDGLRQIHISSIDGSIQQRVADVVNQKMDPTTAQNFVSSVTRLIQGTTDGHGNINETVEERAINREKGLKLAEYIAENYIDESDERKEFLNGIKYFYDNAVLRDKGYTVIERPDGVSIGKPSLAEKEWEAGSIIARVKNTLDMNAVNEDVQRIIKEITANIVSYDDYMKGIREWRWSGLDLETQPSIRVNTANTALNG
jgi:hypothetical protein